jgi:hypothetical protein
MVKVVLGVIAGFVAWTILWLGSNALLMTLSPNWYGAGYLGLEQAIGLDQVFQLDSGILVLDLVRSVIISVISGFLAAVVAGENRRTPIILGLLLLMVGIAFQAMAWKYVAIWYHIAFLALLIPMTIVGAKLKKI